MINRVEGIDLKEITDHDMVDLVASFIESDEIWELPISFRQVAIGLMDEGYIDSSGKVLKYP